jgi:class 3 adenylate cyclase/ribosomal protein L40E
MRCSKCGSNNPPANNFCPQCGNALLRTCLKCGADSSSTSHFCGKCGATLDGAALPDAEQSDRSLAGERRHLTVLFCDLVDSTSIAARLDPEEWRAVVADYHRAAAQAIERFGGHVAQYLGDGVMAYFGWPEAHDNDAERAARAGLALLDAVSMVNQRRVSPELSARVGIDSGTVVVASSAGSEADVFGDAPNVAARMQSVADAGTVMVTVATHRLTSGLFLVEDRGTQKLKGVECPIQLYRVI